MYNQEFKYKSKEYNEVNRVEILEKKRLHRIKNKEEIAAYDKQHYDEKSNYINENCYVTAVECIADSIRRHILKRIYTYS